MKNIGILAIGLFILIGIGFYASSNQKTENNTINIGAVLEMSSYGAEWGENSYKGAQLAVDEINSTGGVLGKQIILTVEDNESSIAVNVSAAQKLINIDKVQYLITGWSQNTLPIVQFLEDSGVVGITASAGARDITTESEYLFRTWPQDHFSVTELVKYAAGQGWSRVAIVRTMGDWEDSLRASFVEEAEKVGITIVIDEGYPQNSSGDVRSQITKVKAANPDAIFIPQNFGDAGLFIKQARELGLITPLIYPVGITSFDVDLAGAGIEGVIYAQYESPSNDFVENFVEAYGVQPGPTADTAYDAVYAITHSIERAGTVDPEIVKVNFMGFDGASGKIEFTESGDRAEVEVWLFQFQNGEAVRIN